MKPKRDFLPGQVYFKSDVYLVPVRIDGDIMQAIFLYGVLSDQLMVNLRIMSGGGLRTVCPLEDVCISCADVCQGEDLELFNARITEAF